MAPAFLGLWRCKMAISILDIIFAILMVIVTSFVGAFIVWLIQDGKGRDI